MDNIQKLDIVGIELNSGNLHREWLNHSIGTGDNRANRFGMRVFRDGQPVSLSGASVQGYFRNSQGTNIVISSGTISGNMAYVTLPQACYNYDGVFTLAIKVIGDNVTETMRIVDGMVDNTNSGNAVAPTGTVPTYQEVLAVYDQMVAAKNGSVRFDIEQTLNANQKAQARANTESAREGNMAPEYDTMLMPIEVGTYAMHNGLLYRCMTRITSDASWTAEHWKKCTATREIEDLKSDINQLDNGKVALYPNEGWYRGYFTSSGVFTATTTNAAPTNKPFILTKGHTLDIYPNGLAVSLRKYTKNGNTYTHVSTNIYTTDTSIVFDADTYISIHVNKSSGATLTLDEVTTKLWITSNIQTQIDNINNAVDELSETTAMSIETVKTNGEASVAKINDILFQDGEALTLQVCNAESFTLNPPGRYMHVLSTDGRVYAGSRNIIDLIGLHQGVHADPTSGVIIEVKGNEIYLHGNTTSGFRYNFQTGEFFNDSFSNHPIDSSKFPEDVIQYKWLAYENDGYTLPSNVYIARLNNNGSLAGGVISGRISTYIPIPKTGQYFAMYANSGITGLNTKFRIGLTLNNLSGEQGGGYNAVPFYDPNTEIITKPGYYDMGELSFTTTNHVYSIKKADFSFEQSEITGDSTFVWFGDSISQLRDLPNLVSDLIGATVYDCSFAGAPLTYGDPTRYQPTGFMSLCSQIVAGNFTPLSNALNAQEAAGINVTEKRQHLATLQALNFNNVTDIVVLAGTNDFDNDYVNATNFVSGFSSAITTLLTAYPHLIIHVLSPIWRGDKSQGVTTIPTMEDIVSLEKTVASNYCLPFTDLYHTSGINQLTASVYLESDILHLSAKGDAMMANRCAKALLSD